MAWAQHRSGGAEPHLPAPPRTAPAPPPPAAARTRPAPGWRQVPPPGPCCPCHARTAGRRPRWSRSRHRRRWRGPRLRTYMRKRHSGQRASATWCWHTSSCSCSSMPLPHKPAATHPAQCPASCRCWLPPTQRRCSRRWGCSCPSRRRRPCPRPARSPAVPGQLQGGRVLGKQLTAAAQHAAPVRTHDYIRYSPCSPSSPCICPPTRGVVWRLRGPARQVHRVSQEGGGHEVGVGCGRGRGGAASRAGRRRPGPAARP